MYRHWFFENWFALNHMLLPEKIKLQVQNDRFMLINRENTKSIQLDKKTRDFINQRYILFFTTNQGFCFIGKKAAEGTQVHFN